MHTHKYYCECFFGRNRYISLPLPLSEMVACMDKSALVIADKYEVMSSVTIWLTEQTVA